MNVHRMVKLNSIPGLKSDVNVQAAIFTENMISQHMAFSLQSFRIS